MDTLDALQQATAATDKIVTGVQPSQLDSSTPCSEWNVRQLLNHMLGSMELGSALLSDTAPDEKAAPPGGVPAVDLVGDDPSRAYRSSSDRLLGIAGAPGALDTVHKTPLGEMPGAALGGILGLDLFVHGWDLARTTNQDATWDQDLAAHVLAYAEQTIQPEMRADGGFVGPMVEVDANASPMDHLLGFMGRTP